jgi:hypothetical protein
MGKKLKITEEQLKRLVENKNNIQEQDSKVEEIVDVIEEETKENEINEAVEKLKSQFKRFF